MVDKKKSIFGIILVGALWLALSIVCWFKPADDISESERRQLEAMPEISVQSVLSGRFMTDFDSYTLDQFPARDNFRTLKAITNFYAFLQKDNNDIYIKDGYAAKIEYPLNEKSVNEAAQKLDKLYEMYVKGKNTKVYLSVVPDKGYFLAEQNGYPHMDYDKLFSIMKDNMPYAEYIDLTELLDITDFYKTDSHWRQEKIIDVAKKLAHSMGASLSGEYTEKTTDTNFYGVYYGQSALPLPAESINYLTNDVLDRCTAYNMEKDETTGLYNMELLSSRDPYEMFLSGATPIITINNPSAKQERKLVVFRDSYASSLIPLLAEVYSEITLVDTRYIVSDFVGDYARFENCDVLFIYSTSILNSSAVLK